MYPFSSWHTTTRRWDPPAQVLEHWTHQTSVNRVIPTSISILGTQNTPSWKVRDKCNKNCSQVVHTGQKATRRASLLWGCLTYLSYKRLGGRNVAFPLHASGTQKVRNKCPPSDNVLWPPKEHHLLSCFILSASLRVKRCWRTPQSSEKFFSFQNSKYFLTSLSTQGQITCLTNCWN